MPPLSFKKLKYLEWNMFPLKCINIDMPNAVVVRLTDSELEILWDGTKNLKKLRILDVRGSSSLTKTADFYGAKNLEQLYFRDCKGLEELHNSVGCLEKLVILDLQNCYELQRFPTEVIGKLRSLQVLDLTNCLSIGLEQNEGFDPFRYSLKECRITKLLLANCNISKISDEVGSLTMLEELDLSENGFLSLPDDLGKLHKLKTINLSDCARLQSFAKLPPNIVHIRAPNCISLTNLPSNISELKSLEEVCFNGCSKLGSKDPECLLKFIGLMNIKSLSMKYCNVSQVPNEIGNLVLLSTLHLSGYKLPSLPDGLGKLLQLERINLSNCASMHTIANLPPNIISFIAKDCISLMNLPSNMSELKSLKEVTIENCSKLGRGDPQWLMKFTGLTKLYSLQVINCNVSEVPKKIENLVSLSSLDLSGNIFVSLPDSFGSLSGLNQLKINDCCQLRWLPLLPSNLKHIEAKRCWLLDVMPFPSVQTVGICDCHESICNNTHTYEFSRNVLQVYKKSSFISRLQIDLSNSMDDEVPKWCSYRSKGEILSFVAPQHLDKKIYGMILCATKVQYSDMSWLSSTILNKTKETSHHVTEWKIGWQIGWHSGPMQILFYLLDDTTLVVEAGDSVVVEFYPENRISECGLRVIYET